MKVLISGYYGFGNLGDEALLSGLLSGLRQQGHRVTVLSQDPAQTRRLHGVQAVSRFYGLLPALLRHDALISGGGGLLQDKTSQRSLQYYLGVLALAKRLGKRTVIYGQSIGPLTVAGKQAVARTLHNLPVAVRDKASHELLASLDIQAELVADTALLLNKPAMPLTDHRDNFPVLLIPRGGYPAITTALISLAKTLLSRGISVAGMALQTQEDNSELAALKAAAPNLELWQADSPSAMLALLSKTRYVVSARLHGLILAAVAEKGFSGIIYDPKVAAFLDEAGAPAFDLPFDVDELASTVLTPLPPCPEKLAALTNRASQGLNWLGQVLSQ